MAAVRSVRFSDLPAVTHPASAPPEQAGCASVLLHPPRVYDDALYSPYDIYTAASIGDAEIVEVPFFPHYAVFFLLCDFLKQPKSVHSRKSDQKYYPMLTYL